MKNSLRFERVFRRDSDPANFYLYPSLDVEIAGTTCFFKGPQVTKAAFLRLVKRGNGLSMSFSLDGKAWTPCGGIEQRDGKLALFQDWKEMVKAMLDGPNEVRLTLPRKMKVGVVADATASGTFKAVFDGLKMTPHNR